LVHHALHPLQRRERYFSSLRAERRSNPVSGKFLDSFAEPVIGRAFARPVGSQ
jgi:hypothetical protein